MHANSPSKTRLNLHGHLPCAIISMGPEVVQGNNVDSCNCPQGFWDLDLNVSLDALVSKDYFVDFSGLFFIISFLGYK
jgi:hypothetical protein